MDGASDNWCHTNFALAAWLLLQDNDIDKIVLSRLIVGHTHSDIDQLFSVLSRYIRGRKGVGSLEKVTFVREFLAAVKAAYRPERGGESVLFSDEFSPKRVDATYDFESWLRPACKFVGAFLLTYLRQKLKILRI